MTDDVALVSGVCSVNLQPRYSAYFWERLSATGSAEWDPEMQQEMVAKERKAAVT